MEQRRQLGSSDGFERRAPGMGELVMKESRDDEERKTLSGQMGAVSLMVPK
jgi:hypothetical protein